MNPEQFELMKQAARNLLAHRDAGRVCDPESVKWAERLLLQNPHEQRQEHEPAIDSKEQP
jgi:hypothetical protein